jgi:Tfp pilus assembly protein PilF
VAVLGSEHPDTLSSLHNLGVLRLEQGRFGEAADLLGRCLDAFQRTLGPGHPDTLTVICQLAAVAQEQADDHRAEELFRWALAGRKLALGNAHPATLAVMGRFADFLSNQGRLEEAINLRRLEVTALVERTGED